MKPVSGFDRSGQAPLDERLYGRGWSEADGKRRGRGGRTVRQGRGNERVPSSDDDGRRARAATRAAASGLHVLPKPKENSGGSVGGRGGWGGREEGDGGAELSRGFRGGLRARQGWRRVRRRPFLLHLPTAGSTLKPCRLQIPNEGLGALWTTKILYLSVAFLSPPPPPPPPPSFRPITGRRIHHEVLGPGYSQWGISRLPACRVSER